MLHRQRPGTVPEVGQPHLPRHRQSLQKDHPRQQAQDTGLQLCRHRPDNRRDNNRNPAENLPPLRPGRDRPEHLPSHLPEDALGPPRHRLRHISGHRPADPEELPHTRSLHQQLPQRSGADLSDRPREKLHPDRRQRTLPQRPPAGQRAHPQKQHRPVPVLRPSPYLRRADTPEQNHSKHLEKAPEHHHLNQELGPHQYAARPALGHTRLQRHPR